MVAPPLPLPRRHYVLATPLLCPGHVLHALDIRRATALSMLAICRLTPLTVSLPCCSLCRCCVSTLLLGRPIKVASLLTLCILSVVNVFLGVVTLSYVCPVCVAKLDSSRRVVIAGSSLAALQQP